MYSIRRIIPFCIVILLLTIFLILLNNKKDLSYQNNTYKYATSNAFNIGESKLKSFVLMQGKNERIPTLEAMADIYKEFHIIGIQEVSTGPFGAKSLAKLVDNLKRKGANWDMLISDPTNGPGKERFGVLFRADLFEGLHAPYSHLVKELDEGIDREPYHCVLKEKATGKLLHIYLFHLIPKKADALREIEVVGKKILLFDKNSTIISGDFNLAAKDLNPVFERILGFKHWFEEKTSIGKKINKKGGYMSNPFDNIFTGASISVLNKGILDFVPLAANIKEAHRISDHLIPWIEFKIK